MFEIINLLHVVFGSLALLGGVTAMATAKGSLWHVRGGQLFALMMGLVVITTFVQMFHEFLPLAIVMCLTVIYLVPSAILSVNHAVPGFKAANVLLMTLLGLLFAFATVQFVRINLISDSLFVGPAFLAALFGTLLVQDWRMLGSPPSHPNAWLRRHLTRMILAFTFAIMALVRIGLNFGLSLEMSVILPLIAAAIVIAVVYRKYPVSEPADQG
ncbi:MAG: hypothetical protein QNJ23_03420 [Woeseiaceae bacterium]|nr:hypothetical protein [Woeseiaceae bacterium]